MMSQMKVLKTLLLSILFVCGAANAHVELYDAKPAANSMLENAPEELLLSFSGDVRMVKLTLTDAKGKAVNFGFKPVMDATDEMRWTLPDLAAGKYTVQWKVMGEDGHTFEDSYGFHVHGSHAQHGSH